MSARKPARRPSRPAAKTPGRKPAGGRYAFARVEDAVEAIRRGEMIIVVDDEDRENEGT